MTVCDRAFPSAAARARRTIEEFSDSIKKAKLLIENQYERKLDRARPTGAIFALKNMGWSDKQEVEFTGSLVSLDLSPLSDEQLERIAAGEHPFSVLAGGTQLPALGSGEKER